MRILKWIAYAVLGVVGILAIVIGTVGWVLSTPVSDETLAKMQSSKQFRDGKFINEEPEASVELSLDRIAQEFEARERQYPTSPLPVISIDASKLKTPPAPGLRVAWLGHAGVLVEIDGKLILTDPILSDRASPFSFAGPMRFHKPPISVEDLSGIDAVIISHNHYDHLDKATVTRLAQNNTPIYVPLGNKPQLIVWGVPENLVEELDWWQAVDLGGVRILATPSRHYSSRGLFDYQETLWASWALVGSTHRVFFSGDTGYSEAFSKIGDELGPFDLTIIKVGAYGPGQMWKDIHMPPEESIQVHKDVKGRALLPVHWGTFDLGNHEWDEPIIRTLDAAEAEGVRLITPKLGEMVIPVDHVNINWWEGID